VTSKSCDRLSFAARPLQHGLLADLRSDAFPTVLHGWMDGVLALNATGTHFGFVQRGPANLHCDSGDFTLKAGMYFAVPGLCSVESGCGIVITRKGHAGFFHLGGPIENAGRLCYIDGCTDSLLIPPVQWGDPCLNQLHLPAGTHQTAHRHPSLRVGLVVRGAGWCEAPGERVPLSAGLAFVIRADALHCFHTDDSELLVVAYHPDSDFGPTHDDHPMINRTLIARGES
jgi:mannose-6-phosphate isomerase-like protein (cupin superfamily)